MVLTQNKLNTVIEVVHYIIRFSVLSTYAQSKNTVILNSVRNGCAYLSCISEKRLPLTHFYHAENESTSKNRRALEKETLAFF